MSVYEVLGDLVRWSEVSSIAHPIVVVYFSYITRSVVVEEHNHHIVRGKLFFKMTQALEG